MEIIEILEILLEQFWDDYNNPDSDVAEDNELLHRREDELMKLFIMLLAIPEISINLIKIQEIAIEIKKVNDLDFVRYHI